jgi:polysaccharide biosynthesis transport protein
MEEMGDKNYFARHPEGFDIRTVIGALRRRSAIILATVLLGTIAAALLAVLLEPRYTATSAVMIEPRKTRVFDDAKAVVDGLPPGDPVVESQAKVLASRSNIQLVIQKLGLDSDPEFSPEPRSTSRNKVLLVRGWLLGKWRSVTNGSAQVRESATQNAQHTGAQRTEAIVDRLIEKLSIRREELSNVLLVSFTSTDPETAAKIANAIVSSYVETQLEAKMQAVQRANQWLSGQVEQLRKEVLESERAVEAYRAAHDLLDRQARERGSLDAQRLDQLSAELIAVRAERIAKDAKLQQLNELRAKDYRSLVEVASSPIIVSLMQREAELLSQEALLIKTYGEKHPLIIQIKAEKEALANKINQEILQIVRNLENDAKFAQARERALELTLKQAKEASASIGRASIQLHELEREADSKRTVYQAALVRFKEVHQQGELLEPDAKVISMASVPAEPSFPNFWVMAAVGFTGSVILGMVLAATREHLDSSLRSSQQLKQTLGLADLGIVPEVGSVNRQRRPYQYLLEKPLSSYSEAVKAIVTAIQLSPNSPPQVILVTSTLPGEGKTTLAMSMGASLAQSGHKTIVVDLDLRHPGVAREFGQPVDAGLVELLAGERALEEIAREIPGETRLHVIPVRRLTMNPVDFLCSPEIKSLLKELRRRYDYVILDSPPTLVVSDARVAALLADAVLFLVQWEKTTEVAAVNGLQALERSGVPVIGAALTRVDIRRHARYGYGDVGQHHASYSKYFVN